MSLSGLAGENPKSLPVLSRSSGGSFGDSAGLVKLYGAIVDQQLEARSLAAQTCKHRRRLDCFTAMLALLVPWGLFVSVFAAVSFYMHYSAPLTTMLAAACVCLIGMSLAVTSLYAWTVGSDRRFYRLYMGMAVAVASSLGWILGDINFWQYMQPSYHIDHLATYSNVDPSSQHLWSGETVPARGGRYQDAGKIYFSHNAVLDRNKAASFKDGNLYCVAPIVNPNCIDDCGFDFWAVGINCCSDLAADFRCGDYNSTRAKSGLRQVVETWRPFFHLAVIQAEGFHGVTSRHPLFFHWVEDPVSELQSWKLSGYRVFVLVMISSFIVNAMVLAPSLKSARSSAN